jgi:DNA repair exonuclease SbcCD ATPase subunit
MGFTHQSDSQRLINTLEERIHELEQDSGMLQARIDDFWEDELSGSKELEANLKALLTGLGCTDLDNPEFMGKTGAEAYKALGEGYYGSWKDLAEKNCKLSIKVSQLHSDLSVAQQKLGETPGYSDWKCSFCGEGEKARSMMEGHGAFICGDCVKELYEMLVKPLEELRDKTPVEGGTSPG